MAVLAAGVMIWAAVHFFTALAPDKRNALISRFGEGAYKSVYSLLIVFSVVLIILGWRNSSFVQLYAPPGWGRSAAMLLTLPALLLVVAADVPGNHVRQWIRHPMLLGLVTWAVAHLLANGDARSVILFGGLGSWALLEIFLINRRDGPRQAPAPARAVMTLIWVAAGLAVYFLLGWLHRWFAGVALWA